MRLPIFLPALVLAVAPSVFAKTKTANEVVGKLVKIEANKGDIFAIAVSNLVAGLAKKDKKWTAECSNHPSWLIQFPNGPQLSLTCAQAYGGIVRLHNPDDMGPRAGVIVGNDWGDEGCFESTSSLLEVTSTGTISLRVNTEFGGEHIDGGKTGCKQAKEEERLTFDPSKNAFQRK